MMGSTELDGMNDLRGLRTSVTIGVVLCAVLLWENTTATGQTGSNPALPCLTPAARPTLPTEVAGITSPHRTVTLAALQPSRIVRLEIAEGQAVQKGELLVVLDDGVQRLRTEMAKAKADCLHDVELARTRMRQASADLERLRHLDVEDNASEKELREAGTQAETTRLLYEVAKFDHQQAEREYAHQQLMLERLRIRAPFSGYVAEVFKEVGETVTEAEEILRIVELDRLEISVDCPLELAQAVRVGERVRVRPADPQWKPRISKIVLVSRAVDPGSQTFKAKLVVDNGDAGWKSGLKVLVDFATAVPGEDVRSGGASLTPASAAKASARESSKRPNSK